MRLADLHHSNIGGLLIETLFLTGIADGCLPLNNLNLDKPMENDVYEELSPLLHRIHAQRKEIKGQMQALKRKQDEFDQITGNMKEGLVLLDHMGRIISINPAARALFGANADCVGEDFLTIDRKRDISLEVSGDDGVMNGVRRLLYEIIYNLCDNAIKYNPPGGKVHVSVKEQAGMLSLCVQDDGIGIAPEYQEKVFERFYRVDKSHSKQSGGTGLGLSIVKHVVKYHHGKIDIQSEPGKGTAISVSFNTNEY